MPPNDELRWPGSRTFSRREGPRLEPHLYLTDFRVVGQQVGDTTAEELSHEIQNIDPPNSKRAGSTARSPASPNRGTMTTLTESTVEDATLAWLEELGYAVLHHLGRDVEAGWRRPCQHGPFSARRWRRGNPSGVGTRSVASAAGICAPVDSGSCFSADLVIFLASSVNGLIKSIGIGRITVEVVSLDISTIVWSSLSVSAEGSFPMMLAA